MRKRILILPVLAAAAIISGCANKNTIEETHPEGYRDVAAFEKEDDTRFALYLPEKGFIDITAHVLDYADSKVMVSENIITDVFEMTKMNREAASDEVSFIEYEDEEGNLLQLQDGGTGIVYNGKTLNSAEPMEKADGKLKISLTDLIFAMGYQKMDQSIMGDIFFVTVYSNFDDPVVTIPVGADGLIEDIYALNYMVATASDAVSVEDASVTEESETAEDNAISEETAETEITADDMTIEQETVDMPVPEETTNE